MNRLGDGGKKQPRNSAVDENVAGHQGKGVYVAFYILAAWLNRVEIV
jgi:hypothetical protein